VQSIVKDTGFSVYSDPHFLFKIGKICANSGEYLNLGLNSLHDYLLIMDYFKEYLPEGEYRRVRAKGFHMIAKILYQADRP